MEHRIDSGNRQDGADAPDRWDREKRQFDDCGHALARGFLSAAEVQALTGEVERYLRDVLPSLPESERFYEVKGREETLKQAASLQKHDPYFASLLDSRRFIGLAEALLGEEVVRDQVILFAKPPGAGAPTPPHQDAVFFMLDDHQAVNLWLALDPVDSRNGGVRFVSGSHRAGLREHARSGVFGFSQCLVDYTASDRSLETLPALQPGDLVAHHALTIHRADANHSARPRRGLSLTYFSARSRRDLQRAERYREALMRELADTGRI